MNNDMTLDYHFAFALLKKLVKTNLALNLQLTVIMWLYTHYIYIIIPAVDLFIRETHSNHMALNIGTS